MRKIVTGYLPDDTESQAYAVLLEWLNIYYEDKEVLIGGRKSVVRVGAVQWQMRQTVSLDDMLQQVEYFVDAVAGYKTDIVLFLEFFNGPLMAQFSQRNTAEAVRQLAEYTEPLRDAIAQLAVAYNVNIIAGSMPEYGSGVLYNATLFVRAMVPGINSPNCILPRRAILLGSSRAATLLRVFELDVGKIGILICYDVEFPELPRLLADQGMQILFVPFWTDTKNAYLRVRRCAQARAIENECYVVISGSVGNLPRVENMDMQYSRRRCSPVRLRVPARRHCRRGHAEYGNDADRRSGSDNLRRCACMAACATSATGGWLYKIAWTGRG